MPFLDFIVCPAFQFAYKDDVGKDFGLDIRKYRKEGHFSPTTNGSTVYDLKTVFKSITNDPHDIIKKIKITTKDRTQRTFVENFHENNNQPEHVEIVTKYSNSLGRCFSVRPKDHVVKLEVIKIDIAARMDIYVYIGYPGQYMYNTEERVNICLAF